MYILEQVQNRVDRQYSGGWSAGYRYQDRLSYLGLSALRRQGSGDTLLLPTDT